MDKVQEFINRRFKIDCNWLNGNCYYFAVILKSRFTKGKIVYDVIDGHFMFKYNKKYYDFTGIVNVADENKIIEWEHFEEYDKNVKKAVIKGCIL